MGNLIEGMQSQMNRCRELLKQYEAIPTGFFGAGIIKQSIAAAEKSIASGDVIEMLKCYKDLEGLE